MEEQQSFAVSKIVNVDVNDEKQKACLPNSVSTKKGDLLEDVDHTCYVCNLAHSPPLAQTSNSEIIASSDSSNSICLFSRESLDFAGRFVGHTDTISQIKFDCTNPSILWSSSFDSNLHCWDLRTEKVAYTLHANLSNKNVPIFSFDYQGEIMAAGSKSTVLFWDLRKLQVTNQPLVSFTESHTKDVTKV